jgi:hypothetical protein
MVGYSPRLASILDGNVSALLDAFRLSYEVGQDVLRKFDKAV